MSAFNLDTFKNSLLTAVEGESGHDMSMLLVTAELMKYDDVRALLTSKGADAAKLREMLKVELKQRHDMQQRNIEHNNENETGENFERSRMASQRSRYMQECVHALIGAVELRMLKDNKKHATAVDVFREALLSTITEVSSGQNPAAIIGALTGIGAPEYAGVKTFEILELKPAEFFPDITDKMKARRSELFEQAASTVGQFVASAYIAAKQHSPGVAEDLAKLLGGTEKKKSGRINPS